MSPPLSNADLLSRLVGFDTTSSYSNLPLADFIADYLDAPGVRIVRNPSADDTKVNLVITLGPEPGPERRGLVLCGHMDVVPAEEPEWQSDPFTLTTVRDAFVGRGACDMKGFLALATNLVAEHTPRQLNHPLVLLFTYDEEVGTLGAKRLSETYGDPSTLPRSTIVGEPTSLQVVRLHKGILEFQCTIMGVSAHSAHPELGRNAIEPAGELISALSRFRRALETEDAPLAEFFPNVPYVTLNIARVTGGSVVNIIPDRCVLECSMRLLPRMDGAAFVERVREIVAETLGSTPHTFEVRSEAPALMVDEHTEVHRFLSAEVGQRETVSASYATDAGWLQRLGLECVIFGPGSIATAHKPNESLSIAELDRAAHVLQHAVDHFCVAGNPP